MRVFRSVVVFLVIGFQVEAEDSGNAALALESLELMFESGRVYVEEEDCFSCHHQGLSLMAAGEALKAGLEWDSGAVEEQVSFVRTYVGDKLEDIRQGRGLGGTSLMAAYILATLEWSGQPESEVTGALVDYLLPRQKKDGAWDYRTFRPPSEASRFAATALAVRGLKAYGNGKGDKAIEAARAWLMEAEPEAGNTEDLTFRVLGLDWAGAPEAEVKKAGEQLLANQREDGGWAQLKEMESDAYATGEALVALRWCGVLSTEDEAFRRGLEFLKRTRLEDGSWHVKTRSEPVQRYFETGFPHGKDQFISITATGWATMALLLSLSDE